MKIDNRIFNEIQVVTKVNQDVALAVSRRELMQHMRLPKEPTSAEVINHLKTIARLGFLSNTQQLYWWLLDLSLAKYSDKLTITRQARGGYLSDKGLYFIIRHEDYIDADLFIGHGDGLYTHEMLLELNSTPHPDTWHRSSETMAAVLNRKGTVTRSQDNFLDLAEGVLASKYFEKEP